MSETETQEKQPATAPEVNVEHADQVNTGNGEGQGQEHVGEDRSGGAEGGDTAESTKD